MCIHPSDLFSMEQVVQLPAPSKNFNQEWQYEGAISDTDIVDIITTTNEVLDICREIDTSKSACVENLSSIIMKDALISLNEQFVFLLNISFETGIFPNDWKKATVI